MNRIDKILLSTIILLVLIQGGLLFLLWSNVQAATMSAVGVSYMEEKKMSVSVLSEGPVLNAYFMNEDYYNSASVNADSDLMPSKEKIYGGILPHHLLVADKIAAFFNGLKEQKYKTIVLVSPNHFEFGNDNIVFSTAGWDTPYGELEPDLKLATGLQSAGAVLNNDIFKSEHGITGLVGFVKKYLPNTKIVPVAVKYKTKTAQIDSVVEYLSNNADREDILVLSSVDFSHYLSALAGEFHDERTRAIIEVFDFDRLSSVEVDSPMSLYFTLSYLQKIKAQKSDLLFSTNSGYLTGNEDEPGTTHNFYYFSDGEKSNKKSVSQFLFFGDLMLDREVKNWIDKKGMDYLFKNLAGEENRFFMGSDLIGLNFESAITEGGEHYPPALSIDFAVSDKRLPELKKYGFNFLNLANNHITDQGTKGYNETKDLLDDAEISYSGCPDKQVGGCSFTEKEINGVRVAIAGFSMVYGVFDETRATEMVKELKSKNDLVLVNVHWGVEYDKNFNRKQQQVGRDLIDAGADIIIGHHPHVTQGMEIYNNKPIFYSLGNFIFDQYFSRETQTGLALGFNYSNSSTNFYLFPFMAIKGEAKWLTGEDKEKFFKTFYNISDESVKEYKKDLLGGELELTTL